MADPGRLVGTGRSADVFDIGGGRVVRRFRDGRSAEFEATVMGALHAAGVPAPEVFDHDGADIVMALLRGRTMKDEMAAKPWTVGRQGAVLGALNLRMSEVPVSVLDGIGVDVPVRLGAPERVLHMDLHPDNVMLTPDGPILFDWTNVAFGPLGGEVAMSYMLINTGDVDPPWYLAAIVPPLRIAFQRRFLSVTGQPDPALVKAACEFRLSDPAVRDGERAKVREFMRSLD